MWFDDRVCRTQSFFLIAENEKQIIDWVYSRYNPNLDSDMISIEIKQSNITLPFLMDN